MRTGGRQQSLRYPKLSFEKLVALACEDAVAGDVQRCEGLCDVLRFRSDLADAVERNESLRFGARVYLSSNCNERKGLLW